MKIAIIVCTFPPYKGGMGNAAWEQARQLVKLGNEIVVFTPRYKREQKILEKMKGVEVRRLTPVFKYGNAGFLPQLFWKLRGFDTVFLHYPFFGGAEVVRLRKLFNCKQKLVIYYHMDVVLGGVLGLIVKVHTKLLMPWIIKSADKVIVSSIDYVKNSDARGLVDEKFIEIPFGVNVKKIRNREIVTSHSSLVNRDDGNDDEKIRDEEKVVLFVGALDKAHYFKGVEVLIEAASKFRIQNSEFRIQIVGDGDMRGEYEKLVKEKGLEDVVKFVGKVSDGELVDYYRRATVLVLPSVDKSEAFGIVLIEAMACGTLVIASDLAGVRSVVDEGVNGFLVQPGDSQDLARKIEKVLKLPFSATQGRRDYEIMKLGEAGRRKVEERYDWEKIGHRLLQIFNK